MASEMRCPRCGSGQVHCNHAAGTAHRHWCDGCGLDSHTTEPDGFTEDVAIRRRLADEDPPEDPATCYA